MAFTHFKGVSAYESGFAIGEKDSEVVILGPDSFETLTAAGAVSVAVSNTKLALVGAGAVTLAAPSAGMSGQIKTIEMTVDNGDVTLSLANVQGGSAATTCTWANVGEALVLVASSAAWNVVSEGGVVLS